MAKKQTKLPSGAKGTGGMLPAPAPYKQTGYWGNMWNNIRWPTITSDPTDRGLPDYLTYSPQSTWGFPIPAYGGVMNPGARGGWNTGTPTIVPQHPELDAAVNAYNASQAANAPPSGVPLYGVTRNLAQPVEYASQRAGWSGTYAGNTVLGDDDGYNGMPQNYWWMSDEEKAATDKKWADLAADKERWSDIEQAEYLATYYGEYDENGNLIGVDNPRPGDPYQVYPYWKHDKDNVYGLAGRGGKVTQLQYGKSQPDWVRKLKPNPLKPTDTNKTYDNSLLDNLPTTPGGNLPAWAGDLVSWRT